MPTSSASQPPTGPFDLSADRSRSSMKATSCFWYGRSRIEESSPRGSGASTGCTISTAFSRRSAPHVSSARVRARAAADDEPEGRAGWKPSQERCFARAARQVAEAWTALQCSAQSLHTEAGLSQTMQKQFVQCFSSPPGTKGTSAQFSRAWGKSTSAHCPVRLRNCGSSPPSAIKEAAGALSSTAEDAAALRLPRDVAGLGKRSAAVETAGLDSLSLPDGHAIGTSSSSEDTRLTTSMPAAPLWRGAWELREMPSL